MNLGPPLRYLAAALLLAAALTNPRSAEAAGPLLVNGAGTPLVWATNPVPFNPDRGTLGRRTNAEAVADVTANFAVWAALPTSTISFVNADAMPVDVTAANFNSYVGVCGDGLSPIVFDTDGTITDDYFGPGASNSILGFAAPDCGSFVPPVITEGFAVLNGKWIDGVGPAEIHLTDFNAVFIHEFGHYINLDHSQINLLEASDHDRSTDDALATMFPVLVNGTAATSLHLDDQVAVSTLYPEPSFASSYGTITGSILAPDGAPFQGAFVIARQVGNPRMLAVGSASGARYFPAHAGGPPAAGLQGFYELRGLPSGNYTVEVEAIHPEFSGSASVGPLESPAPLPGPPEFWNGANESSSYPPDDPAASVAIVVSGGSTRGNIDIRINDSAPPPSTPTPVTTPLPLTAAAEAKCERAIAKSARTLAARKLGVLALCTRGIFRCVETKPDDAACVPKAAARCTMAFAEMTGLRLRLTSRILGRCDTHALPVASLLDASGLGYGALSGECQADFGSALSTAGTLATCIERQHECEAERLFALANPRAGELLRRAGLGPEPSSCLADFTGNGDGVNDALGSGKKIDACAKAIAQQAAIFVSKRFKTLSQCLDAVSSCSQATGDMAGCVARARGRCDIAFARSDADAARLALGIARKCSDETIAYATLRAYDGVNLDALVGVCASHGIASLDTLADYTSCLRRQHECRTAELLRFQMPRAEEALSSVGRVLRGPFCPAP